MFITKITFVNPEFDVGRFNVLQDSIHVRLLEFANLAKEKVFDDDRQSGYFIPGMKKTSIQNLDKKGRDAKRTLSYFIGPSSIGPIM